MGLTDVNMVESLSVAAYDYLIISLFVLACEPKSYQQ